jgi:hypothetical protein
MPGSGLARRSSTVARRFSWRPSKTADTRRRLEPESPGAVCLCAAAWLVTPRANPVGNPNNNGRFCSNSWNWSRTATGVGRRTPSLDSLCDYSPSNCPRSFTLGKFVWPKDTCGYATGRAEFAGNMNGGTCSLAILRDGRDGHDPVVNCEAKIATWPSALHQTSAKGDCVSRTGFRDPLFQQVKSSSKTGRIRQPANCSRRKGGQRPGRTESPAKRTKQFWSWLKTHRIRAYAPTALGSRHLRRRGVLASRTTYRSS